MKRVAIYKPNKDSGIITNLSEFDTEEEAIEWKDFHIDNQSFGKQGSYEIVITDITAEVAEKEQLRLLKELKKITAKNTLKEMNMDEINTVQSLKEVIKNILDLIEEDGE
jgi:hypothetical protein